jgi:hypothetical protein
MQVPKAHIHPLGENSPNLVTLVPSNGSSVKRKTTKMYQTGLPDGIGIWIPKIPIWKHLGWPWNRKCWFILNPLVYFKAIGIFCCHLVYISPFCSPKTLSKTCPTLIPESDFFSLEIIFELR